MKPVNPGLDKITPLPPTKGVPPMPKPPAEDITPKGETPPPEPKKPGTEIANWKDRMAVLTKQTKLAEKPAGGFISFKGGRMTLADEIIPGDKLRCIIIDYRKDYEFYDKPYNPNVPAIPSCYAIVRPHEDLTPWSRDPETGEWKTEASDPQVAPGVMCEDCPMFQWGSDLKGGKGKACKTSRRLHVFAADDCTNPADVARASYMTMIPPATSIDNFQKVANQIVNVLDTPIFGAVVEISVTPHDRFLFMVHFKIIEQIKDEGLMMALLTRHESISAKPVNMPKPDAEDAEKAARGAATPSKKF
jgi:hypothetical protein